MSNKKAATMPEEALQEQPARNGTAREPASESAAKSCVDGAPDEAEIAGLAHRLWLDRGCPEGNPEEDWFLAERELRRGSQRQDG